MYNQIKIFQVRISGYTTNFTFKVFILVQIYSRYNIADGYI